MDRRSFLELSGALVAGLTAAGSTAQAQSAGKRILVIGAGMAGLTAAQTLKGRGYNVLVLEARDRIGGRVWTSNKWPDVPVDFGASWIHGVRGNPLTRIAEQAQSRQIATSYNRARTYNTSGRVITRMEEASLRNYGNQLYRAIDRAQDRYPDTSLRQIADTMITQLRAVPDASRFINFFLNVEIEHDYSGSASSLSTNWYDSDEEFSGNDVLLEKGFATLTDFMAKGLTIELNQIVKQIDWSQPAVRVITERGEFTADQVIVTIPLGVLQAKSVAFTPALPAIKQNAIDKLGMGVLNKCYLRFPTTFWPIDLDWIDYIPENHGQWAEWVSFRRAMNQPVLIGFNAADYGKQIEALPDTEIVASAMTTLRTMFGENIPNPVDYQITRWASDPYARGSYSFNAVGSVPLMRVELARSVNNRLFFAGEASEQNYFGTAHGAYLSGLRAAGEVLAV
ncbi:MAG: flavin monoamine oxidase family protein [Acidobacteriota bacterium]|jgi:monoamine oxidase